MIHSQLHYFTRRWSWSEGFRRGMLSLCVVGALVAGAWGCEGRMNRFVERADSAGIEIVRNTSGDRVLRWRFHERVRVRDSVMGSLGSAPLGPGQVGADSLGNLYVLDRARSRIVVYDSIGGAVRVVAGQDRGNDRLDNPVSITVQPGGAVQVFDMGRARMIEFATDGEVTGQRPLAADVWDWRMVAALGGLVGIVRATASDESADETSVRRLIAITPSDTIEVARRTDSVAIFEVAGCEITASAEPVFAPRLVWDATRDLVAVTSGAGYVVNWYSVTGPWRSIRRAVSPRPVDAMIAAAELGSGLSVATPGGPCRLDPNEEVQRRGAAPVMPAVAQIVLQPDQTMWVVRGSARGEDPLVDTFTPGGVYLGTHPPGSPIPVAFTPSGDLVAVERGESSSSELVVYGVERRR